MRVAEGDETAFRELLHHFHPLCYATAFKVLQNTWMAEDIVQDVFLKVWLRRAQLMDIDNFGGWLRTVTANRLYDYLKKKKAEASHVATWWQEGLDLIEDYTMMQALVISDPVND